MSAKVENKKFGKGERAVPHHSDKAQKWYAAEDENKDRKVRFQSNVEMQRWWWLGMPGDDGTVGYGTGWGPARIAYEPKQFATASSATNTDTHTHTNRKSDRTLGANGGSKGGWLPTELRQRATIHEIVGLGMELELDLGDATRSSYRAVN